MPPYAIPYMPPYAMNGNGYLPLYMVQETDMREDLKYLQEMFPEMARRYAAKIASVVDRLDYKGSMIYDEYPDRIRLQRLAHDITQMIEKEEADTAQGEMDAQNPVPGGNAQTAAAPNQGGAGMDQNRSARRMSSDSNYREELIYVLLSYEIAKRRHGAGMDLSKFYGVGDV